MGRFFLAFLAILFGTIYLVQLQDFQSDAVRLESKIVPGAGHTTYTFTLEPGQFALFSSGSFTVEGYKNLTWEGGQETGNVTVFVSNGHSFKYVLSDLVPENNWIGIFQGTPPSDLEMSFLDKPDDLKWYVENMGVSPNCGDGCDFAYVRFIGPEGFRGMTFEVLHYFWPFGG